MIIFLDKLYGQRRGVYWAINLEIKTVYNEKRLQLSAHFILIITTFSF